MQITLDTEMRELLEVLKWIDWHETYICAIRRDTADGKVQSALVVTGSLYKRLRANTEIHFDYWAVGDLFTALLTALAYGFPVGCCR